MWNLIAILHVLCVIASEALFRVKNAHDFYDMKEMILEEEREMRIGYGIYLNEQEQKLDEILRDAKHRLIDRGYADESKFRPSQFFLNAEPHLSNSSNNSDLVYEILKRLNKGCLLHTHLTASISADWLINFALSQQESCYFCENDETVKMSYLFNQDNEDEDFTCEPCPTDPESAEYIEVAGKLKKGMTMYDGNDYSNMTIKETWEHFEKKFGVIGSVTKVWEFFPEVFEQLLTEMAEDGVLCVEWRSSFSGAKARNGSRISFDEMIKVMEETTEKFRDNRKILTSKIVVNAYRVGISNSELSEKLWGAQELYQKFPDTVKAMDFVGSEEEGRTLASMASVILDFRKNHSNPIPLALHAGETGWTGLAVDKNVVDAVLLDTRRIGHGYALDSHPEVMELVRRNKITVELNPLSNQILRLVDDVRNHRNKHLLDAYRDPNTGEQFVLSVNSDDRLIFGTRPLTDDFYAVLMGMTHADASLAAVKQLAIDSIQGSLLSPREKKEVLAVWEGKWLESVAKALKYAREGPEEETELKVEEEEDKEDKIQDEDEEKLEYNEIGKGEQKEEAGEDREDGSSDKREQSLEEKIAIYRRFTSSSFF